MVYTVARDEHQGGSGGEGNRGKLLGEPECDASSAQGAQRILSAVVYEATMRRVSSASHHPRELLPRGQKLDYSRRSRVWCHREILPS